MRWARARRVRLEGLLLLAGLASMGCDSRGRIFLEAVWPEDERVVLALLGADGSPIPKPEPQVVAADPVTLDLGDREGSFQVVAQSHLPLVLDGAKNCGLGFSTDSTRSLGPGLEEWRSAIDGEGIAEPFSSAAPSDIGLWFERCQPPLTPCDELSTNQISATELADHNLTRVIQDGEGSYLVAGFTDLTGEPFVMRTNDRGELLQEVTLASRAIALVATGDAVLVGLSDGNVAWLDPSDLGIRGSSKLFPSAAMVRERSDGLLIAFSGQDTKVFELSATSTQGIERPDFPKNMIDLDMVSPSQMVAASAAGPPVLFDAQSSTWRETDLRFPTPSGRLVFADGSVVLVSETRAALLPETEWSELVPRWTELAAPIPPVPFKSVAPYGKGVLIVGNEDLIAFYDSEGEGCTLRREPSLESEFNDVVALGRDRAVAVSMALAGIGVVSPRLFFIGPR